VLVERLQIESDGLPAAPPIPVDLEIDESLRPQSTVLDEELTAQLRCPPFPLTRIGLAENAVVSWVTVPRRAR
jgi:hypothetical protein